MHGTLFLIYQSKIGFTEAKNKFFLKVYYKISEKRYLDVLTMFNKENQVNYILKSSLKRAVLSLYSFKYTV